MESAEKWRKNIRKERRGEDRIIGLQAQKKEESGKKQVQKEENCRSQKGKNYRIKYTQWD